MFPIGHEGNLTVRRWPVVTVAIIVICLVAFILTDNAIQKDNSGLVQVRTHILILHARFPELPMSEKSRAMVEQFKRDNPDVFRQLASAELQSPIDAQLLMDPEWNMQELAAQMAELCRKWDEGPKDSFLWEYAYHSERPTAKSYITAAFLHGGWLHLIMNMWFLYLVGALIEDAWGHFVYPIFYLAAGAAAAFGHGLMHPHSVVSLVGASGAVAGLMGAFMVRFPKARIRVATILWFRLWVFPVPAWAFLLFWVVWEVIDAFLLVGDQVAHWAHVSGFVFGAAFAGIMRLMPLEKIVNPEDPTKTWTPDQEILDAMEMLNQQQPDDAQAILEHFLAAHPDSIDAHDVMLKVHSWKGDREAERATLVTLAGLHLGQGDAESAWHCYEQFRQAEGTHFPVPVWSWLIRFLEHQQAWERAAMEYERLAREYPADRASLDAMMSAARIHCTRLNAPSRAESLYRAVAGSAIPHLDLEMAIQEGLRNCSAAVARGAGA